MFLHIRLMCASIKFTFLLTYVRGIGDTANVFSATSGLNTVRHEFSLRFHLYFSLYAYVIVVSYPRLTRWFYSIHDDDDNN